MLHESVQFMHSFFLSGVFFCSSWGTPIKNKVILDFTALPGLVTTFLEASVSGGRVLLGTSVRWHPSQHPEEIRPEPGGHAGDEWV